MSTHQVEVVQIDSVMPHPNADRLEIAQVKGWQVVIQKGAFQPGHLGVYFPIDSILPEALEAKIFGPDSKIKLNKSRVKTIKLRGAISQGMIVPFEPLDIKPPRAIGTDLTELLGVTKYEPPAPEYQKVIGQRTPRQCNPHFRKYTSIENYKNHTHLFLPEDDVIITEKIHGTNFRAGWVEFDANTLWKRFKKWLGVAPKYEFVFGSHNVQLQNHLLQKSYHGNLYAKAAMDLGLKEKLPHGYVIYGELYGPNIQKGYHYGKAEGEYGFVAFDLMVRGEWVNHTSLAQFCRLKEIPLVPILFQGEWKEVEVNEIVGGESVLCKDQKVREGVVVRSNQEEHTYMGRKILKCINPEYLLTDPTDFH